MNDFLKKILYGIGGAIAVGIEELIRRKRRQKRQQEVQDEVNKTAPKPVAKDFTVKSERVQISVKNDDSNLNLARCQEINLTKEELDEWKSFLSTTGGEAFKAALAANAFNGLVECNVPLKDLCRVNGNPDLLRGYVVGGDGQIIEHAKFQEVGIANAAPLLIFQCMAAVTSQYYQQIITERLNDIDAKLDELLNIFDADKKAKLKVAYDHFADLSKKSEFDDTDKIEIVMFTKEVEELRESYRIRLFEINLNLNDFAATDKMEAELKIKKLHDSDFFNKLEMAMQAEALCFIASAVSVKVANYLGKNEDAKIYAKRMDLDWNICVDQFNRIKHDVLKYLELQANSSFLKTDSIKAMREDMNKKFGEVESRMLKLQNQLDHKTVQYVKFKEDGTAKKYIPIAK